MHHHIDQEGEEGPEEPGQDDERPAPRAPRAASPASVPAAPTAAAPPAADRNEVVEILRGDRVEERKFRNQPVARETSHGSE